MRTDDGVRCVPVISDGYMVTLGKLLIVLLLLQEIEQKQMAPELYPYNSRGPVGSHYLAAKHGVRWGDMTDNPEDVI